MSVLSDAEIRKRIAGGWLVPGGDPKRATECSYSFVPGRAFLAGSKDPPVDFPGAGAEARVLVEPGKMIWIRPKDSVKIPKDVVGFWWQTNTLSRKGLMLVNMSMVEPGYEGDLACLFVNFGKGNVLIEAQTAIAKMVFASISGTVVRPFTFSTPTSQYDTKLNELSIEQPPSFLQVGELAVDLQTQKLAALEEIRGLRTEVKQDAETDIKAVREAAVTEFKNDVPGMLKKTFWWLFGIVTLLTISGVAISFIKGQLFPDVQGIARSEAEKTLRERTIIQAAPNSAETTALIQRIDELNRRIAILERSGTN